MTNRRVGTSCKRPDDPRLLTGRGRYVDDLVLPRLVHVAFVRSPHAHAAIARVDVADAEKSSGVVTAMTAREADGGGLAVDRGASSRDAGPLHSRRLFKYVLLIMRLDNKGEGGILALLALLRQKRRYGPLILLGLFGTALLYGDGVITPAISVLSAVEGLEVAAPALMKSSCSPS